MAKFYDRLTTELHKFIAKQQMFFVATAPNEGRINLSPKGMDTCLCLDDQTLAYLDLTGSGNETAAHILENGRITIMFCSFATKPLILRLYGQGEVIKPRDRKWPELIDQFPALPGVRQIICLHIESLQTSCGFAVPVYEFQEHRQKLVEWAEKKGDRGIENYWRKNNLQSIDGLPSNLLED
ncbi:pyridoxamine 5'-phosphate oxidase-related FMN-binding protein [Thalassoporum mexicanum PCC 7367]|uniref:pyridoxamine 5'-phosphate oxidase family protein n=1 Tax=Thalassoporum mexicanum TaxID=3457544 RepID=UPI00029FC130|nr:pyridoxamine 5'-phosphate oxidase family protein [Pseudanabaena sp. PCC 7367]AFY71250.1 pyridoxamine 5'-phosphate oxidase-related FMN-binding protein [Pseudanabaena sp. PCC 7367]